MTSMLSGTQALRTSAALVMAGAVLSGPVAMLVVSLFAPQPAWTSVSIFAENYHPLQVLPYALGYLLLGGFVLFSAACHALATASRATAGSRGLPKTGPAMPDGRVGGAAHLP